MDVSPETELLEGMRSQRQNWQTVFSELIDNSIDANAKDITFIMGTKDRKNYLRVKDNGVGCAKLDVLFKQGAHRKHGSRKGIGRYGIGLKQVAVGLWGITTIKSIYKDMSQTALCDWEKLRRSGKWHLEDATVKVVSNIESGTEITFSKIDKKFLDYKSFDRMVSELGFIFSMGIEDGIRINITYPNKPSMLLKHYNWPQRENILQKESFVCGRRISVDVGIVPRGVLNPRMGLTYRYGWRVIPGLSGTGFGCGSYNPTHIAGSVDLSSDWKLTTNKDDIAQFKDELGMEVEKICKPILERGQQISDHLSTSYMESLLAGDWGKMFKIQKEKRDEGDLERSVLPSNSTRKRNAKKRQTGESLLNDKSLAILFGNLSPEYGIAKLDIPGKKIIVSEDHYSVKALRCDVADAEKRYAFNLLLAPILVTYNSITGNKIMNLPFTEIINDETQRFSYHLGLITNDLRKAMFPDDPIKEEMDIPYGPD